MAGDNDIPGWLQAGGGVAGVLALLALPYRALSARIRAVELAAFAATAEARRERDRGEEKLWTEIKEMRADSASFRATIATRDEVRDLFREHEARMVPLIRARHPNE